MVFGIKIPRLAQARRAQSYLLLTIIPGVHSALSGR